MDDRLGFLEYIHSNFYIEINMQKQIEILDNERRLISQ